LPEEHWQAMEPEIRQELMPVAETWVLEEGAEIVAFVSLLENLIGRLFVHPDHQGKGHGRALVEHVRGRFDPVLVEVFKANERAISFYRSCGFVDHEGAVDEISGLPQMIMRLEKPSNS
jgi:putative acetyltransferase